MYIEVFKGMIIQAFAMANYINMRNYAALSFMKANDARMGMISSLSSNPDAFSLNSFFAMDTQFELDAITNSLQYKMAQAQIEQLKKQQAEDAKRFNVFG